MRSRRNAIRSLADDHTKLILKDARERRTYEIPTLVRDFVRELERRSERFADMTRGANDPLVTVSLDSSTNPRTWHSTDRPCRAISRFPSRRHQTMLLTEARERGSRPCSFCGPRASPT